MVKKVPGIFTSKVTPETLERTGGTVTISLTGEDLTCRIWYLLRKGNADGTYEVVGEKKNEAEIEGGTESEFTIEIPANEEAEEVTYQIKVKETDPFESYTDPTGWNWSGAKILTVKVAAKAGENADKAKLTEQIRDAESRNEKDYKDIYYRGHGYGFLFFRNITNKNRSNN